jgi:hypothetical protein
MVNTVFSETDAIVLAEIKIYPGTGFSDLKRKGRLHAFMSEKATRSGMNNPNVPTTAGKLIFSIRFNKGNTDRHISPLFRYAS